MKRQQHRARFSTSEALEQRIFLSGNVVAQVVDGNLNITGDASGNVIFLSTTGLQAHRIRVVGDGATTINNQSRSALFSGVMGDVTIRLNGGTDSATLTNMTLPEDVHISQGGGDSLRLNGVTITKSLSLQNSSTALAVNTTIANSTVGNNLTLTSGDGGQNIVLLAAQIHGDAAITTGAGADSVKIDDSVFRRDVDLSTGLGADNVQIEGNGAAQGSPTLFDGPVSISTGAGDDSLQLGVTGQTGNRAVFADTANLAGGTGSNTLRNLNATFTGTPVISNFNADVTAPTVLSTNPVDLKTNFFLNNPVAATFSEAVNPSTITSADFGVTAGGTTVPGTVHYDVPSNTATFTPTNNLAPTTVYTATISGGINGVKDLAGNALASDKVWTFTTGTQIAQAPINLGAAKPFAVMATASIAGAADQINGDVGLNAGSSQGIPPSEINGTVHVDDQAIINAQTDLLAAYNDAVSRTVTSEALATNIGGLTFTPGLYTNATAVSLSGSGPGNNVTLDAQGDPNAIFIFKIGTTLTTASGAQIILAGGAKASNIFWQVGTSATLGTTTMFQGNILAAVTITVNTGSVITGRLLGGSDSNGSVTVNASTVTVPTA